MSCARKWIMCFFMTDCLCRLRLRPHVSGYFWIRNFLFPDSPFVHTYTYPPNSHANPQLYESALQSGNVWIRKQFGTVWTGESGYFWIRWRGKVSIQTRLLPHERNKHIKQTYTLMLNLPHFLSLHCLGVIDLEIHRDYSNSVLSPEVKEALS